MKTSRDRHPVLPILCVLLTAVLMALIFPWFIGRGIRQWNISRSYAWYSPEDTASSLTGKQVALLYSRSELPPDGYNGQVLDMDVISDPVKITDQCGSILREVFAEEPAFADALLENLQNRKDLSLSRRFVLMMIDGQPAVLTLCQIWDANTKMWMYYEEKTGLLMDLYVDDIGSFNGSKFDASDEDAVFETVPSVAAYYRNHFDLTVGQFYSELWEGDAGYCFRAGLFAGILAESETDAFENDTKWMTIR